jgi:glutathione synthase/RimK-type ligase-like ATP-grasp enzyme
MILLCGIPSESPLALVAHELNQLHQTTLIFNQRRFTEAALEWELTPSGVGGRLQIEGKQYLLEEISGVYTRLMDDTRLPELNHEPAASPLRRQCRSLHDALYRWYEVAPARVVNRTTPQGSNASKPYQAQIITSHGFATPETLITNDPRLVREFAQRHGRVVYKSISGVRSIVQLLHPDDFDRLNHIRWCPVQFQAYVPGTNIRVHTIDRDAYATEIHGGPTDYRYSAQVGDPVELRARELPDDLTEACINLAADLNLPFAGIDLKITPEGQVYCFEVNPSPAFSYYETNTGQPIARALATYLSQR